MLNSSRQQLRTFGLGHVGGRSTPSTALALTCKGNLGGDVFVPFEAETIEEHRQYGGAQRVATTKIARYQFGSGDRLSGDVIMALLGT